MKTEQQIKDDIALLEMLQRRRQTQFAETKAFLDGLRSSLEDVVEPTEIVEGEVIGEESEEDKETSE